MLIVPIADWHLTDADRAWFPRYLRSVFAEIAPLARRVFTDAPRPIPLDWEASYTGTLTIKLYHGYAPYENGFRAGLTHWFEPGNDAMIELAWGVERSGWAVEHGGTNSGLHPLRHEAGHFFELQSGLQGPFEFGHGTDDDRLMKSLKADLSNGYYGNFKVVPGDYPAPALACGCVVKK